MLQARDVALQAARFTRLSSYYTSGQAARAEHLLMCSTAGYTRTLANINTRPRFFRKLTQLPRFDGVIARRSPRSVLASKQTLPCERMSARAGRRSRTASVHRPRAQPCSPS